MKELILANTRPGGTALLGDIIRLYLAAEDLPLWQAGEKELEKLGIAPPFWAFAWAGGQALAQYILDNPDLVKGKRVLDFACGSGLQGIAALKAGAAEVLAADIDPHAIAATDLNAALNQVRLITTSENLIGRSNPGWDLVLAGDVCYDGPMADEIMTWLHKLAASGTQVLLGDPGRTYLPRQGLQRLISYSVQTTSALEDTDVRNAVVWELIPSEQKYGKDQEEKSFS
ncbi:50S ribosomal protein L11 methyltransferase [Kiloniella laminariae]|uniref:50S ribosomal protein L11 methyltransferase n=2 Tax=Kiloniella laminariae TaxID=454162 RepID=A0ABT4LKY4_9PROT|nr:50S ribosomal protein L11 methyltransferase [Kiloniella laminariae]MCZ4281770.1 50S ribosomal protein L11 methyltransferase [Kiloniella laminariae]